MCMFITCNNHCSIHILILCYLDVSCNNNCSVFWSIFCEPVDTMYMFALLIYVIYILHMIQNILKGDS